MVQKLVNWMLMTRNEVGFGIVEVAQRNSPNSDTQLETRHCVLGTISLRL